MSETKLADTLEVYTRRFTGEACTQIVLVQDEKIVAQKLVSDAGSFYTGDGNPEIVGESKSVLRGKNFVKARAGRSQYAQTEYDIWKLDLYAEMVQGKEAERAF